jgi:hypothetical protein
MTLEEIYRKESLSIRTYNICKYNDLNTLEDILKYYKTHRSFKGLRNCGTKTDEELKNICKIYIYPAPSATLNHTNTEIQQNISLDELNRFETLSRRTYNICKYNDLQTLLDLILFQEKYGSFKRLRNCGTKSEKELNKICLKYKKLFSHHESNLKNSDISSCFYRVHEDPLKRKYLLSYANSRYTSLSERTKNAIKIHLITSDNFDIDIFISKTILNLFDFNQFKSAGSKTVEELDKFKKEIENTILELDFRKFNEKESILIELSHQLSMNFTEKIEFIQNIEKKQINLLQFLDQYVFNSSILDEREKDIFVFLLNKGGNQYNKDSLKRIASKHGLSSERVRQLAIKYEKEIKKRFSFIINLFPYCYDLTEKIQKPVWEIAPPKYPVNYKFNWINNSKIVFANVLNYLSPGTYYVLSPARKLKPPKITFDYDKYKKFRNITIYYTINDNFFPEFNLIHIFETVYNILVNRIDNDRMFKINNLESNKARLIVPIISENFQLNFERDQISLKRNTLVTASDIIQSILLNFDELMTAEQIQQQYNKQFPKKYKNINSIRSALRNKEFIYLGGMKKNGESTYGLKKWVITKGLKPGSIKNLCFEFLETHPAPAHIYELAEYILKHRDTTEKNILQNLKLDQKNQFIFYPGGFIGIKSKVYPNSLITSFKNPSPQDAHNICSFLKNHGYYEYQKLIHKYSNHLDLKPIQIEHIIKMKSLDKILKINNGYIYYNMIEEDSIMNSIFSYSPSLKVSGFNPYKIRHDKVNFLCRIIIVDSHNFNINLENFEFPRSSNDIYDTYCLIFYHKSMKSCVAYMWKTKALKDHIFKNQFDFTEENSFFTEQINDVVTIFKFPIKKSSTFCLALQNGVISQSKLHEGLDFSVYSISGMSKFDAYSHIITKTEECLGVSIDLLEAKRIYNEILIQTSSK